jgi:hypothetical protein
MAFDQTTRNRLQKFVSESRGLLSGEFTRQLQNDYGMDPDSGTISDIGNLTHLNDAQHQTAKLLRETMGHYQASSPESDLKEILSRIVREQAFTVLNRLCALRMAEARGILIESISKGYNAKGFQLYARVAGTSLGEIGDTYRNYLFSVFDEFAIDLAVLFDRYSPMGRLFPKESVLLELLDQINHVELENLWAEDETIGWVYQYFNSKEERKKMRDESSAPRNSRELAVRNQFFTPRYVVEFLTDNTLGRIWYEMTQGNTILKDQCRYLVRRPNEIFLEMGEKAPEQNNNDADLSQEELLNRPVYIEHHPIKDPREILMLDPACGSMHFGLYAFDLFEKIYEETWDLQASEQWSGVKSENFELLTETYPTNEELLKDIPRLIIEYNIHGIDIDPRAVQIAGLSLWLRAQRSWKEQNIKPRSRPQIRKSKIVCAEPMPGEKDFLKEFADQMKPRVLGQLVEIIFEKMELAGEAGSLLKIEEEIEEAVEKAREEFNKELLRRKDVTGYLPGMAPKNQQRSLFDFKDLPNKTKFWQTAEEKILEALKDYSEQAEAEDGGKLRLFVEDAAKGFAFIDLCRRRYDVVLMNPPFGLGSKKSSKYLDKEYFGSGKSEVCASFFSRALELLEKNCIFGAISSRTFYYLYSLKDWRCREAFDKSTLCNWIDLGQGILDDAFNETAAYIVIKGRKLQHISRFGMYHKKENKKQAMLDFIRGDDRVSYRSLTDFESLPDRPLCYWASKVFLQNLSTMKTFGEEIADVQMGLAPRDEFRFSRLWWEISAILINRQKIWMPYAKGGELTPYYSDVELLLNAKADLYEIKAALNQKYPYLKGNLGWVLHPENHYFEPGLTFGQRTTFLRTSALPSGGYFSVAGKGIFGRELSNLAIMQLINTPATQYLVSLRRESWEMNPQYQEGDVYRIPWPIVPKNELPFFEDLAFKNWSAIKSIFIADETDHSFITYMHKNDFIKLINAIRKNVLENESLANEKFTLLLSFQDDDIVFIQNEIIPKWNQRGIANLYNHSKSDQISFWIGCLFGRWDIRFTTGEQKSPELPDPFDPLPVCPPGMLQNTVGLPAEPKDVDSNYPLRISWFGIIVDDEGHPEDIIARVRDAIEVIWKDKSNDIEQEACEILSVRSLREYFGKPTSFFADHLKRYSKSRRQAPIYWPLSTPSGSYTLWLYYHRLTDQTLYTCVNNFVGPKLKQLSNDADSLRIKSNRTRQEEKDLEKLFDLALELKDFHDELLRIAKFWKPNLNDGVQITAAPLWKLFQLTAWQTKLKQTWKDLEKGKYDWAHLAYSIWPERVIRASHKDRSYAIAHDLESDLWEEIETGTDKKGNPKTKWVPKKLSENELKQIIHEKMIE